jgi:hypothetical protein
MADSGFTVQVINLKCLEAQENDGDEIELRFNGAVIWRSGKLKMHHRPSSGDQVSEFDFAGGRRLGSAGWQMLMPYNPGDFRIKGVRGEAYFEIWEQDRLSRDDFLGRSPVSARDAGRGQISIVFRRDGGHYLLTYRVTA